MENTRLRPLWWKERYLSKDEARAPVPPRITRSRAQHPDRRREVQFHFSRHRHVLLLTRILVSKLIYQQNCCIDPAMGCNHFVGP